MPLSPNPLRVKEDLQQYVRDHCPKPIADEEMDLLGDVAQSISGITRFDRQVIIAPSGTDHVNCLSWGFDSSENADLFVRTVQRLVREGP